MTGQGTGKNRAVIVDVTSNTPLTCNIACPVDYCENLKFTDKLGVLTNAL
jgi:hypothetical protein